MASTKNELQAFSDSATAMTALDAVLENDVKNGNLGSSGKSPILKLNQDDGNWYAGLEGLPIQHHDHVIIRANSARHGFVSWMNRQKTGEIMVPYSELLPSVSNEGGHAWQKQVGFDLVLKDDPTFAMRYDVSSEGGKNFFNKILSEIANRPSREHFHPIVALSSTTGTKGGYNTKYPDYTVIGWADDNMNIIDGNAPMIQSEPGNDHSPAQDQRPQRRTRSAA